MCADLGQALASMQDLCKDCRCLFGPFVIGNGKQAEEALVRAGPATYLGKACTMTALRQLDLDLLSAVAQWVSLGRRTTRRLLCQLPGSAVDSHGVIS